jgi:RNA polymerase sigma factor (sigma-70 family)
MRIEDPNVKLAADGDLSAFEGLYRSYHRRVYGLCLRMTRNASDAEDLTQNVFLQLFRKLKTFRGESSFSTWLHHPDGERSTDALSKTCRQDGANDR